MNFFLGFLAGSGAFDGLAAAVIVFGVIAILGGFNAVIASIPAFIVFCVAKAFLEGLTSNVNNRFVTLVVPIAGALVLAYFTADAVYKSEQAKDAEREVQKQQNMTQQDKVYYIQRSLMFSGYGVTIDGKWGKKTMRAAQKYSGSSATSIDGLYEAVRAKKEGRR